ncbi:hypothetical protein SDC9_65351 [bioreactor metagenome]|uniref:Uncharacterized protein n=1 Tax=bioreactor metagenome TaxID=1076179 RepID=A0A644XXB7_9ZZZZ
MVVHQYLGSLKAVIKVIVAIVAVAWHLQIQFFGSLGEPLQTILYTQSILRTTNHRRVAHSAAVQVLRRLITPRSIVHYHADHLLSRHIDGNNRNV